MSSVPVFSERYPHEAGFASVFAREISPLLWDIEQDRQKTIQHFIWTGLGFAVIMLLAIFLLVPNAAAVEGDGKWRLWVLTVLFMIGLGRMAWIYQGYSNRIKGQLVPRILNFFPGMSYTAERYLTEATTKPFEILPAYDKYRGEDLLMHAGTFEASELKLTETRGSGKNRRTVTTFKGLALKFRLPRKVSAPIIMRPDGGMLGNWLGGSRGRERITLEDPVFEKLFEVYSSDQIESRRVLQPALMLRMVQFAHLMENWGRDINTLPDGSRPGELPDPDQLAAKGIKFSAGFTDNGLLMLVPCKKDLFQPGSLFTSAFNIDEMRCVLYQIHLIRLIVTELEKFPQLVD